MKTITGAFEVKLTPETLKGEPLARLHLDKQFHGPLEAASTGQMLSYGAAVPGSAVYVAIELVTGTLEGRKGSFVLHHTGVMDRGAPSLSISVAPDSGTEALTGLKGTMQIRIESGKHFYDFTYSIA